MAHNIEIKNGVASYVENGRKERAWHGSTQSTEVPRPCDGIISDFEAF